MTTYLIWAFVISFLLGCTALRAAAWWALVIVPLAGALVWSFTGDWLWFAIIASGVLSGVFALPTIERENAERARRGLPPMTDRQLRRRLAGMDPGEP